MSKTHVSTFDGVRMSPIAAQADAEATGSVEPLFVNHRILQALRLQVAILDIRARPRSSDELEPFLIKVELLLRDLVREAGAA
jgi:hypothetical protein